MSDKITPERLQRPAIVYVRQSSQRQLVHNTESTRLQYAMAERVRALGWKEIEIVDEDQGRSAATTSGRTGFQRMVADVALGKIGAVAAIEVSRFARVDGGKDPSKFDGHVEVGIGNGIRRKLTRGAVLA
jgi:DNA invertase Pin-like site-specific DNA recombinase